MSHMNPSKMPRDIPIPTSGHFSIHNIPFGVFAPNQSPNDKRCATIIGDHVVDLRKYAKCNLKDQERDYVTIFSQPTLRQFASLSQERRSIIRARIIEDLNSRKVDRGCFIPIADVTMHLPMNVSQFSDFYCSIEHANNCSQGNVPDNWYVIPSVYNSRTSSMVVSPHPVQRPCGVYCDDEKSSPAYRPTKKLDFELEIGLLVSKPIPHGSVLDIKDAQEHIFGLVLLNDWSARDIQWFERNPLGPFHGKGFGTLISPWVVTLAALRPFECASQTTKISPPLKHLQWSSLDSETWDIRLRVTVKRNGEPHVVTQSNLNVLYWSPYQQLAHLASAAGGISTGDLVGTGTISGSAMNDQGIKYQLGCLLEIERMKYTTALPGPAYLEDGDEVTLEGWCGIEDPNEAVVGFGTCKGRICPASTMDL